MQVQQSMLVILATQEADAGGLQIWHHTKSN